MASLGIDQPLVRLVVWLLGCALVSAAVALSVALGFVLCLALGGWAVGAAEHHEPPRGRA